MLGHQLFCDRHHKLSRPQWFIVTVGSRTVNASYLICFNDGSRRCQPRDCAGVNKRRLGNSPGGAARSLFSHVIGVITDMAPIWRRDLS